MTKFTTWKKVTKINSRIISKPHAHLQTMEKTCAKFQKVRYTIVWRVVLTRYPLSIKFHRIWCQKMTKFTKWKNWQKLTQGLYPNHTHIFRPSRKHVQSFKKISIKLYEQLRSQGTYCLFIEIEKWLSSQSGKSDKKQSDNYIQTTCISSHHEENICKVSKRLVKKKNCKRSCAHRTPMVNADRWRNGQTDERTDKRTETCMPKSHMLKQLRQKWNKKVHQTFHKWKIDSSSLQWLDECTRHERTNTHPCRIKWVSLFLIRLKHSEGGPRGRLFKDSNSLVISLLWVRA